MSILQDHLTTMIIERGKLDAAITALQNLETGKIPVGRKPKSIPQIVLAPWGEAAAPKRRKFSASARKRISKAQKARWANVHAVADKKVKTGKGKAAGAGG